MNVLMVHNRYLFRGGEDEVLEAEESLLEECGHKVGTYIEENSNIKDLGLVSAAIRSIWSQSSYRKVKSIINEGSYQFLNVHNFFPLISPSVYYAGRAERVPVIQTLHNYRLICPNSLLYHKSKICEKCVREKFPWAGVLNACYKNSFTGSFLAGLTTYLHQRIGTWTKDVDLFITLSEFQRRKFIEGGIQSERMVVKPNFVYPTPEVGSHRGGYVVFVGRLEESKGIRTLLKAWNFVKGSLELKIIGDGPLAVEVREISDLTEGVNYLGRLPLQQVMEVIGEASLLVCPSEWYEPFGRVVIEAYAKGTPVLASNIGALSELIDNERTGLYFEPGNAEDLACKIEWFFSRPREAKEMGKEARLEFEAKYTAQRNYELIKDIYQKAQELAKARV